MVILKKKEETNDYYLESDDDIEIYGVNNNNIDFSVNQKAKCDSPILISDSENSENEPVDNVNTPMPISDCDDDEVDVIKTPNMIAWQLEEAG